MDFVKDVAQIIYYLTLSIAGPLALVQYLKAKERDKLANEYKVYDELNNRFFEYQKIALEYYDLDILDVPNNDPSLSFDKKRKQEMVAYSILFSLFERAFLMFHMQSESFQLRQWSGWKHYLTDFIRRETVRSAWRLSKGTYDTQFQAFMDEKIGELQLPAQHAVAEPTRILNGHSSAAEPLENVLVEGDSKSGVTDLQGGTH
jgi:hypothetical protein